MDIIRINECLSIAGVTGLPDGEALASAGCRVAVNVRPDGEETGQVTSSEIKASLTGAGLEYRFVPVTAGTFTRADVEAFAKAVSGTVPVLAFCDSGLRALSLHVLAEALAGRMSGADIDAVGKAHGFDLSAATGWLEREASRVPQVQGFYDPRTSSVQYVVVDPATGRCAIIDPVLDFDEKSGSTSTANADAILDWISARGLVVEWILDTHPHADHFSAAHYLAQKTGAPTAIGARVVDVQNLWKGIYNWPELETGGSWWNRLFEDGDTFRVGNIEARVMLSPGHTLASVSYVIGDAAFVHDTLFMPDSGSARADFPGGSARVLWKSICDIMALPDETRLFTGHDYQPGGRHPVWESTVASQRRLNPHLAGMDGERFIALREARDRTLPMPKLILHALQVNIRGGRLPEPEANGKRYLKFPLDALDGAVW